MKQAVVPDMMGAQPVRPKVGFIVGPTGVGKSALALLVARELGAEIVNADSRQLYRAMDIGTAKPSAAERAQVRHHLLDVTTPDRPLDAARFRALAHEAIAGIVARGRRPLVVGGSGLYLRALRQGLVPGPAAADDLRCALRAQAAREGPDVLHRQLREVDAASATRIHPHDLQRIVRALEVYRLSGVPLSRMQQEHGFAGAPYASLTVGLTMERARLYRAIDSRFEAMMAAGLEAEVRELLAAGYAPEGPALGTIGYRQIAAAVRDLMTRTEAVELAKRETRRLAKRQLTWFRRDPAIVWIDAEGGVEQALRLFREFFAE
jgi:tRNA dimethylallyltransferase